MNTTPPSLMERLRQTDDREAWDRLVRLYTPLLYYWARQMGLREADAADLVQDVFALLLVKLPDFVYDPGRSFRAWLRTVTYNRWREVQRRLEARPDARPGPLPDLPGPDAPDLWEEEYQRHVVRRALELMQSEFETTTWQACWAVVVEGRSAGEVGRDLGMTAGAVRVARFRVLARLRQELAGMLD
jgi:RNA polymerase sigma-70 factor (ECF subfamily)